jgi:hypothetical protein
MGEVVEVMRSPAAISDGKARLLSSTSPSYPLSIVKWLWRDVSQEYNVKFPQVNA